jgi:hypothetical protein
LGLPWKRTLQNSPDIQRTAALTNILTTTSEESPQTETMQVTPSSSSLPGTVRQQVSTTKCWCHLLYDDRYKKWNVVIIKTQSCRQKILRVSKTLKRWEETVSINLTVLEEAVDVGPKKSEGARHHGSRLES